MINILNTIKTFTHTSNASGKHEKQIAQLLKNNGYSETTIENLKLEKQLIRDTKYNKTSRKMWYIPQPCGSQSFPDFIVGDKSGQIYYLECKSSKADKIVWNSGMPKDKAIYIFSSGKHNKQTFCMGSDLWSKEEKELQIEIRKLIEETYRPLKNPKHKVEYYVRHMHQDKKPVYGHEDREQREKKVHDFIRGDTK